MTRKKNTTPELPEVSVSDDGEVRHLHLGTPWIQGSMRVDDPFALELEYVQRMMAWLLFVEPTSVTKRHAMQLGLGAGAITKFCHKKLRLCATAIELNPQVLAVCRQWFKLPPDGAKLRVILGDAAKEIRDPMWLGTVDALAVDLYDHEAAAPVLDDRPAHAWRRSHVRDLPRHSLRSNQYTNQPRSAVAATGSLSQTCSATACDRYGGDWWKRTEAGCG